MRQAGQARLGSRCCSGAGGGLDRVEFEFVGGHRRVMVKVQSAIIKAGRDD